MLKVHHLCRQKLKKLTEALCHQLMIDELLLALAGYPGPILHLNKSTNQIQLASETQFPFLHASEKIQIQQLCEIASLYHQLNVCLKQDDTCADFHQVCVF